MNIDSRQNKDIFCSALCPTKSESHRTSCLIRNTERFPAAKRWKYEANQLLPSNVEATKKWGYHPLPHNPSWLPQVRHHFLKYGWPTCDREVARRPLGN